MSSYEELRQQHIKYAQDLTHKYAEHIEWDESTLLQYKSSQLRKLLEHAKEHSVYYKGLLNNVDTEHFSASDLGTIPSITKQQLMGHWDNIVTRPELTLGEVTQHLTLLDEPTYFKDQFHIVATGGTSGVKGIFPYNWHEWAALYSMLARWGVVHRRKHPRVSVRPMIRAQVSAKSASHLSASMSHTFSGVTTSVHLFSMSESLAKIVEKMNELQPTILAGYPSALNLLALEAEKGNLHLDLERISSSAEKLAPSIREKMESVFKVPVHNFWSCTEGAIANPCGEGHMHINEDMFIVEAVDNNGAPVPTGEKSNKILLTNLYNYSLPLIRYEIGDEFTLLGRGCPCGSSFMRIADVGGRTENIFYYSNGTVIHPQVIWEEIEKNELITEYQIFQTRDGAIVKLVIRDEINLALLQQNLTKLFEINGLKQPQFSLQIVEQLPRSEAGKLKIFVPLEMKNHA